VLSSELIFVSSNRFAQQPKLLSLNHPNLHETCWHSVCHLKFAVDTLEHDRRAKKDTTREENMHDIDRTQLEIGPEEFEEGYESEDQYEAEAVNGGDMEGLFSEAEEMEMASELLEVTDENELDQFLGGLLKRAKRKVQQAVGRVIPPSTMQVLGGFMKGAVRKALPGLTSAVGTAIGGPAGGALAGRLAPLAGRFFGLELEGLSPEDQEFEVARNVVRLSGAAAQQAATIPDTGSPQTTAQQAVVAAAQQHAPGFLRRPVGGSSSGPSSRGRSGRWIRRGSKIVLLGA
jgi:hypothetical protein